MAPLAKKVPDPGACYSQIHMGCSLQLLLVYHVTWWYVYKKIVTSNWVDSTVYHIKLVFGEKA